MARTKKVGSTGRFGTRYGRTVRQKVQDIEKKQKKKHKCPFCNKTAVKRVFAGVYECKACKVKFAGKAYFPKE